jgi:hypothetical protein
LNHVTLALSQRVRWVTREIVDWPVRMLLLVVLVACSSLILSFANGGGWALCVSLLSAAVVIAVIAFVADPSDRRFLLFVGITTLFGRHIVTLIFDMVVLARTATHSFAPDEALYLRLASKLVDKWHDPSVYIDPEDGFFQSEYVLTVARIFYWIGPNVIVIKLINTTFAVLTALLAYRTMANLQLPGRRWSFAITLLFPSVVLWSALALKDAYVWLFIVAAVWTSSEYIRSRNHWWHIATLAALLPIESVRRYIFVTMGIAWLFVILAVQGRERLRAAAVIASTLVFILVLFRPLRDLGVNVLYVPIAIRESGAIGGRTSFVDAVPVVRGDPGDRVLIQATNATPPPGQTPREVVVEPGAQVVFEGSPTPTPGNIPPAIVRPGDIVVFATPAPPSPTTAPVGTATGVPTPSPAGQTATPSPSPSPSPTPAATRSPSVAVLNPDAKNVVGERFQADSDAGSVTGSLMTNLRHLPLGLAFVFGAPFPWTARTLLDFATIPEALAWYFCLAFAIAGFAWLLRGRDFRYAHGVAAAAGMSIVFALIESNVGTLIRSRDMMVPLFIILTGVGIEWALALWPALARSAAVRIMRGADSTE